MRQSDPTDPPAALYRGAPSRSAAFADEERRTARAARHSSRWSKGYPGRPAGLVSS